MPPKSKAAAAAAAEPVAVEDLFTSLHRHIEAGAFEQAAKVADQGQTLLPPRGPESRALTPRSNLTPTGSAVLKAAPGDEDAVRCKVVAYIKADEIDKALAAIRAAERLPIDLSYYKVKRLVLTCSCSPDGSVPSLCCHPFLAH